MGLPEHPTILSLLKTQAGRAPEAAALRAPGRLPLSHAQLCAQVEDTGRALHEWGLGRGDRVAIVLPNGPEMAAAFLAVSTVATSAPLNPDYRSAEFTFYLDDLNAKALLVVAGSESPARAVAAGRGIPVIELSPLLAAEAGRFELARPRPSLAAVTAASDLAQPDDVALVLHTSGTTSRPKMVPLTHRNLYASARHIRATLELGPEDCCLNVMPLFHIHGLVAALLSSLAGGGSVICSPGFYAPKFFNWMAEFQPTWYTAVPTMHQAFLERARGREALLARRPLRFLRSSSAALAPQLMADLERTFGAPVIEAYGMTEAAHQMASNPLPPAARKPGSVGRAAGPEIAILDEAGRQLPAGEAGEIVIRGPNVMAGYLGNPAANAQAFTDGWFRTGDQGRLDADGYLFITGRLKEIINRGGEKISPREVDEVLLAHPAVAQAVTFAMPDPKLGEEVAAAVVLRPETCAGESELQEFAAARLAACKVPRRVLLLDDIPKGPTGKLQRIGLADRLGLTGAREVKDSPKPDAGRALPRTLQEDKLLAIWREVLGIPAIGVEDNFFHLGGDSVLAAQVLARVRDAFGVQVSMVAFFNQPTVAALAGEILRAEASAPRDATDAIQPVDRTGPLPLSSAQQRLWFLDRFEPHNPAYNRPAALRLRGPLDRDALARSLEGVVRRHEALRTRFPEQAGRPVAVLLPKLELSLPCTDLQALPEAERLNEARRLAAVEARRKLDLSQGPLTKARLLQLGVQDHVLVLTFHHIVFDGWSMDVLRRELAAHYAAYTSGAAKPALADLGVQYGDYAHWQQQCLEGGRLRDDLAWWRQHLAGDLPVLELPADRPRPPALSGAGARHTHRLPAALAHSLRAAGQREGATLFMTLLAAFKVLLHRYTGQEDLIVGCPVAGRNRTEIENLIGVFVNTLPLRTRLAGKPPFRELLAQVRCNTVEAYARQAVPFEKIVDALQPARTLNRTPVFQVTFQLRNLPAVTADCALPLEEFDFDPSTAKFDLSLEVVERSDGLHCVFEYSTDLFDAASIQQLAGHYQTLLEGIAAKPETRIGDLPMGSESEREQVRRLPEARAAEAGAPQRVGARSNRFAGAVARVYRGQGPGAGVAADAPGDELERALIGIWEKHLRVRPVGVGDDFFELGGNSLLALSVFSDVARLTGTARPLSLLFEAPTIGQLAAALRQEAGEMPAGSVVAIQPRGSRPPLFCVPGAGVDALSFRNLARQLGEEQPFYGFTAPGFDGRRPPLEDICALAKGYLGAMQGIQPAGPYQVGGLSFGGLVAWEMACQLQARGQAVALLVLLDTYGPGLGNGQPAEEGGPPHRRAWNRGFELVQKVRLHGSMLRRLPPDQRWPYLRDKSRRRLAWLFGQSNAGPASPLLAAARHVHAAHLKALRSYQPPAYAGRVILFRGRLHLTPEASRDRALGWSGLADGGLEVHDLPGFHQLMIAPPFVESTASELRACLAEGRALVEGSARRASPDRMAEFTSQ